MSKVVITYGTFDTLHWGHIEILRRAKEAAGENGTLVVGVSTDEFNAIKGKKAYLGYEQRKKLVEAIRYVDLVIPENEWDQKPGDFAKYKVDILVMGDDWKGAPEFENVQGLVEVRFFPRTKLISSSEIRAIISQAAL
jgi:glycerol-3-phosphate cytidylyltransferase